MNKYSRLLMAVAIVGLVSLLAGGVWALPILGTVPPVPPGGDTTTCETIDMGTSLVQPKPPSCSANVTLISPDDLAPAPAGMAFAGDAFRLDLEDNTSLAKICYAYPPEFAGKNVKIYKLNELANPPVWTEVPGAIIENGVICVTTTEGVLTLIGNQ